MTTTEFLEDGLHYCGLSAIIRVLGWDLFFFGRWCIVISVNANILCWTFLCNNIFVDIKRVPYIRCTSQVNNFRHFVQNEKFITENSWITVNHSNNKREWMDGICSHSFIHVCLMAVLYSWSTTDPAASRQLEERQSYTGNKPHGKNQFLKNVYLSGKGRQLLHIHVINTNFHHYNSTCNCYYCRWSKTDHLPKILCEMNVHPLLWPRCTTLWLI